MIKIFCNIVMVSVPIMKDFVNIWGNVENCNSNGFPLLPEVSTGNLEWTYTMRRTMQEIIPGVFLGPYSSAISSKLETLQKNGITHIICVRQSIEAHVIRPNFPEYFRYLVLSIADSPTESIIQHFSTVKDFINSALEIGGKVLVHGNAGISRSAALVLAYIMGRYGLTFSQAYTFVQGKRFCINPNEGFVAQLIEYEPIYKAQHLMQNSATHSQPKNRNKRNFDAVDDR